MRPSRATVDVDAAGPGWLLFSRTYFPTWRATLDGEPRRVLLANGHDVAVAVPAGKHRVEVWWDETTFRRGVILQMAGALLVLVALLISRARSPAAMAVSGSSGSGGSLS